MKTEFNIQHILVPMKQQQRSQTGVEFEQALRIRLEQTHLNQGKATEGSNPLPKTRVTAESVQLTPLKVSVQPLVATNHKPTFTALANHHDKPLLTRVAYAATHNHMQPQPGTTVSTAHWPTLLQTTKHSKSLPSRLASIDFNQPQTRHPSPASTIAIHIDQQQAQILMRTTLQTPHLLEKLKTSVMSYFKKMGIKIKSFTLNGHTSK
ncbi:MAG: hypothetical protein OEZ58_06285 [Gammaproteobacteria bacterium]|nr:hypothetical protein [Gammaproteobacteria bacterium]MDH5728578.1 hypothetical protein [Gammaproteobacteria bacterium]